MQQLFILYLCIMLLTPVINNTVSEGNQPRSVTSVCNSLTEPTPLVSAYPNDHEGIPLDTQNDKGSQSSQELLSTGINFWTEHYAITYAEREPHTLGEFTITAYCTCKICCGNWSQYKLTASGTTPKQGRTIAVDPTVIPIGTVVFIDGEDYIAEDTGSAINNKRIDIYFNTHADALEYGVQQHEVIIPTGGIQHGR